MKFSEFATRLEELSATSDNNIKAELLAHLILEQEKKDVAALIYLCQWPRRPLDRTDKRSTNVDNQLDFLSKIDALTPQALNL